jgi:hypothetical protein
MVQQFNQNSQPFIARQLFVNLTISLFRLGRKLFTELNYKLGSNSFRVNLMQTT